MTDPSPLPFGRFGPALTGGPGRSGPKPSRVVLLLLSVVLAVLAMAAGAAASLVFYGQATVTQLEVGGLDPRPDTEGDRAASAGEQARGETDDAGGTDGPEELEGIVNVLAIGTDSRDGLSDDELRELGTERAGGQRTDTIMLVQLDLDRDEVRLLSFPRDLLVTRCDGSRGRINGAYAIGEQDGRGGPTCLVETVTELTDVAIHHFVEVDFAGFINVVDALDGVSMWLEEPLEDEYAGIDLSAGCVTMDGPTALGYVRSRHADDSGDFGRIERQQQFLNTVLDEAVSMGTVVNPARLFRLVNSAAKAVETDEGLGLREMNRLAYSLRNLDAEAMDVYTVPGRNRRIDGAWLVVSRDEQAEQLYEAFRDAEPVPEGVGVDEPGDVVVGDVPPLHVLDGSGRTALAWDVASALEREGFEVADSGRADSDDFEVTQVVFPEGRREEAQLVAEELGGANIVAGDAGEPLTVMLGADFSEEAVIADDDGAGRRPPGDVGGTGPDTGGDAVTGDERADATPTPESEQDPAGRGAC